MSQVIVTTGDLKRDYEFLGPVCVIGAAIIGINAHKFRTAFCTAVEELKKQAQEMDGDAVVAMRQGILITPDGVCHYLQIYGTAVKYK